MRFVLLSAVELIKYYLPNFIFTMTSKTTGNTLGLTSDECFANEYSNDYEIGTVSGEIHEINKNNEELHRKYNVRFIKFSNFLTLTFEFVGRAVFAIASVVLLFCFVAQQECSLFCLQARA